MTFKFAQNRIFFVGETSEWESFFAKVFHRLSSFVCGRVYGEELLFIITSCPDAMPCNCQG